jgi:hypothetical protein
MITRTFAIVLLSVLAGAALPCQAQEKELPRELPSPKKEASLPTRPEPCCGIKVLWVDYFVPVKTLYAKEYIREEECGTWEVAYKDEDRVVTEIVITPKDITKEVTYCTTEPITTTDAVTGVCTTTMQQVTRTKLVKDTIFEAAEVKRTLKVPVAYLVPAKQTILHKYDIYEWKTDLVMKGCAVSAPGGETANTHQCIAPPPMPHYPD